MVSGEKDVLLSVGAWASMFLPKAKEKMFPPIIGDNETNPQFCEKCAGKSRAVEPVMMCIVLMG